MAVTSGFFNSLYGDRKYTAEQFSALFNGLINDGVFSNIGTAFRVSATTDNNITIGIGRAWFNGIWVNNDALLPMTCNDPEVLLDRIDAVVIEINRSEAVRAGRIIFVKGTASGTPVNPTLTHDEGVDQYPLAYIRRKAGVSAVVQADITNCIGTSACPYVTGILETQNIDNVVAQWESQFNIWFDGLQVELEGDVAANLASQVIDLNMRFDELAETRTVTTNLQDSSLDTIEDSSGAAILGSTVLGESSGSDEVIIQPTEPSKESDGFEVGDTLTTSRSLFDSDNWLLCNGAVLNADDYTELASKMLRAPGNVWNEDTTGPAFYRHNVTKMIYAEGKYVFAAAGDTNNRVMCVYSTADDPADPDAVFTRHVISEDSWGLSTSGNADAYDIIYAKGYYVVVGRYRSNSNYNAQTRIAYATSLSGPWTVKSLWTATNDDGDAAINSVAYGNGYFVVAGYHYGYQDKGYARIAYTTSPELSWTQRDLWDSGDMNYNTSTSDRAQIFKVVYLNNEFIFLGSCYKTDNSIESPVLFHTSNLATGGTLVELPMLDEVSPSMTYTKPYDIAFVNGRYIIVGSFDYDSTYSSDNYHGIWCSDTLDDGWVPKRLSNIPYKSDHRATIRFIAYDTHTITIAGWSVYHIAYLAINSDPLNDDWIIVSINGNEEPDSGGLAYGGGFSILNSRMILTYPASGSSENNSIYYKVHDLSKLYLPSIALSDGAYTFIKARSE